MVQIPLYLQVYKFDKLVTDNTQPRKFSDKVAVFSDVTPSCLVGLYLHFGGTCYLYHHVFYCRDGRDGFCGTLGFIPIFL